MLTSTADATKTISISGVSIPDSKLASEATELVRDTEPALLFNHSTRLYYFASIAGKRRELKFDPELLFIGPMFHDMGLAPGGLEHCSCSFSGWQTSRIRPIT